MAYFQLADKQVALHAGDMTVGSGAGVDIPVSGDPSPSAMAVVTMKADGAVSVRRGYEGAPVKVNGVQLGVEPTPLIHGDKLEVAGHELTFGDDKKSGSTQFLSGAELAELAKLRQQAAAAASGKAAGAPTASTGGRIVSLTDGREYQVSAKGLSFGREASCDVVIASGEVSRNHAEISSGPDGYYIIDTSTNGIWVNGKRVDGTQTLGRADVIRVGPEEFRFYADKASSTGATAATIAPAPAAAPAPAPVAAPVPVPPPAPAPKPALSSTAESMPAAPPPVAPKPAPAPAPAPAPVAAPKAAPSAPAPAPQEKKGSPLVWIVLGIAVIGAAAAYFLLK